jgi:phosphatidate cytidylyltransferase
VSAELTRRVLFGVVAAPIGVGIVLAGGAALAALLAVLAALAAWEFFRIARAAGLTPFDDLGIAAAGLVPLVVHARYLRLYDPDKSISGLSIAALALLVVLAAAIWRRGVDGHPLSSAATTVFGIAYTGGMLSYAYAIRYHDYAIGTTTLPWAMFGRAISLPVGGLLLLMPVLITWASDIGAYAVGRAIGRNKLIPSVSPGKTREGAVGGLAASVLLAWAYATFFLHPSASLGFKYAPFGVLVFGAVVSVAAQIGDLAESLLKREAGVKDSSHIIPGHGGVLDRFDSLLFVLPVAFVLLGRLLTWAPR